MKRHRSVPSPLAPFLCSLAVATAGCSEDDPERRSMEIVATVEVVGMESPPPTGCVGLLNTVIRGEATHMGRVQGTGRTCILSQTPSEDPPFVPAGPPPYATAPFRPIWVLEAESGDELWLEGGAAVAVLSMADNSLRAHGTMLIVGGTGSFTGAIGELEASAVNDDGVGPDDFTSSGWVQY